MKILMSSFSKVDKTQVMGEKSKSLLESSEVRGVKKVV